MKYKKIPIVVEAVQWNGDNLQEVVDFGDGQIQSDWGPHCRRDDGVKILTLEGLLYVAVGDFIIKGVHGEFYSRKPDIFAETYEEVFEKKA